MPVCWANRFYGLVGQGAVWPTFGMRASELAMSCVAGAAGIVAVQAAGADAVNAVAMPGLPDAHGFAGSFAGLAGGRLLVAGGANFPDGVMPWDGGKKVWHKAVFAFDPASPGSGWKRVGDLPGECGYGVSVSVPEGVLMIGGGNASEHSAEVWLAKWEGEKVTFTRMPALPIALANMCGAKVGDRIHVVGGIAKPDATTCSARHFMLDWSAGTKQWTALPPMPGDGVMLATAGEAGGKLLVAGGCSLHAGPDGKPVRTYLKSCYSFADGAWTKLADLPRCAVGAASPAWTSRGKMVLVGGDDGALVGTDPRKHPGFRKDLLAYDSATAGWETLAELETGIPVTLPGVQSGDEFILVSGEIRPGVRTPAVTKLHPAKP